MSRAGRRRRLMDGPTRQEAAAALTRESLPPSPARLPPGFCKRLKAAHCYELDSVVSYPHRAYRAGRMVTTGVTDYKTYRCTGCGKKRAQREVYERQEAS